MAKHKKVVIIGKYRTSYGVSLQKNGEEYWNQSKRQVPLLLLRQNQDEEIAVGIWHCGSCVKTVAGGAWTNNATLALTVKSSTRRLKELKDQ